MSLLHAARTALLRLGVVLGARLRELVLPRLAHLRLQPQRGASAIEWVIITAVVVILVTAVGVIIQRLVLDEANNIQIDIPDGT